MHKCSRVWLKFVLLFTLAGVIKNTNAQNNVGIGTVNPHPSAQLDISDSTKGVLFPRLTNAQKNAILNPAIGLTIYNTSDSVIEFFNGICWRPTYSKSCNSCYFNMSLSSMSGTIVNDSAQVQLTVNQTSGNAQNITFAIIGNLPSGLTYTFSNNPQFSNGNVNITFHVTSLTPGGTYPVIIQGICDGTIHTLIYQLTTLPCTNCSFCNFNMSLSSVTGTIANDSAQVHLTVSQTSGVPQNIAFGITGSLPTGLTYAFSNNPQFSNGNVDITFHVTSLTPAGTYPLVIQGYCGSSFQTLIYQLTVLPCTTNCNFCSFDMSLSNMTGTILNDSVQVQLSVNQTSGNPQYLAFTILGNLPPGLTFTFSNNPLFSSGNGVITFHATPLTPAGTYAIAIQGNCDDAMHTLVYRLTVPPCYQMQVNGNAVNYDLATAFYAAYPSAPTNSPVCIVCTVNNGVSITNSTTSGPAFTTGNLPAGSHVAIINNGNIIGHGGDGGIANDPPLTGAGYDGGNAINLTVDATIINNANGYILGGGGGGNGMAFPLNYNIPPPANFNFGIFLGGGGGGGAGGGLGGIQPSSVIGLVTYINGNNGTNGIFGTGGAGGILNYSSDIPIGPVNITLDPLPSTTSGGNGGNYGANGLSGNLLISLSATYTVNIPFIGNIPIPILVNVNIPSPPPPPVGIAGKAIKRNGFIVNIPDNTYNTAFLKGVVGP